MADATPLDGDDGESELAAKLRSLRLASNDGMVADDVVFGHLSITVKVRRFD